MKTTLKNALMLTGALAFLVSVSGVSVYAEDMQNTDETITMRSADPISSTDEFLAKLHSEFLREEARGISQGESELSEQAINMIYSAIYSPLAGKDDFVTDLTDEETEAYLSTRLPYLGVVDGYSKTLPEGSEEAMFYTKVQDCLIALITFD